MRAARIDNGVVADLWEVPSLTAYEGIELINAPDEVCNGWLFNGSVFSKAPLTTEEVTTDTETMAASVRSERNALIAATDYYALTDVTMDSTVTAYRQALRDIPAQEGFPHNVTWPEEV